jgi:type IV pilus assembly protein PilB
MALFEIMTMDDEMRELIMKQANTARAPGRTRASAACGRFASAVMLGIYEGQTTIDEVVRETMSDDE